jgi:pyruvate formate lyase activating enzyme
MNFGGFQSLTLSDFPSGVACIVFTQGCNLRCSYCHNPQLVHLHAPAGAETPTESQVLDFLQQRRAFLDAVVISGGEPTLQPDLIEFLGRIKSLGFRVKLDTNGTNPQALREALQRGLLDYVAMDVKHDPPRYAEIAGAPVDPDVLATSRDLLLSSGVACEFRTTVVPKYHDDGVIGQIARFCTGASRFFLQCFCAAGDSDLLLRNGPPPTIEQLRRFKQIAGQVVANVEMR